MMGVLAARLGPGCSVSWSWGLLDEWLGQVAGLGSAARRPNAVASSAAQGQVA
jgi:hypothetical protein